MTTGLTNFANGATAIEGHLLPAPAVEPARNAAADSAAQDPCLDPNLRPVFAPDFHPDLDANPSPRADLSPNSNADSWRVEVSARLERYRTRRKPRTPRYPSLLLPFDSPESWSRPAPPAPLKFDEAESSAAVQASHDFAFGMEALGLVEPAPAGAARIAEIPALEQSGRVIEFPRSAAIPVFHAGELADPILDRPRIVEAPDIVPLPPALGGILIEPVSAELADRRAGADFPAAAPSASIARRAFAAIADGLVLAAALAAFGAIFLRLNPIRGPLPLLAAAAGAIAVLLWMTYQFSFLVYTGSTPGLRAARLRLATFDGSPLNRRLRRWRVLASFLSAFSAGLGYLWCVLDQDGLCWHDRITRTCIQPVAQPQPAAPPGAFSSD